MQNDFEKGAENTIDITVQATKLTSEVLRSALNNYLNGKAEKQGRMSYKALERKSGAKLDSIEITDNNIQSFLKIAKKYDIDFALKRDATTFPPTYHVFFRTSQTENFNRAFKEYATGKSQEISKKPYDRQKLQEKAQEIANQPRERKEKVLVRSKESSL